MSNYILGGIYLGGLLASVMFGIIEGLAAIGASVTLWLVVEEIRSRVDAYLRRKYQQPEPPRRASGL